MKRSHTDALVKITVDLEGLLLDYENRSQAAVGVQLALILGRLTTVVGAIQMDQDEMNGDIE